MTTRTNTQFIGFMALITAINAWSWLMLREPLSLFAQVRDATEFTNYGWLHGPFIMYNFHPLMYKVNYGSQILAVLLIDICLIWLAYQFTYHTDRKHLNQ